jgi:hypothetical protein
VAADISHYLVIGLFTSGLVWSTTELNGSGDQISQMGAGLVGILVLIGAEVLAFTGRYPQGLFDLVMGSTDGATGARWLHG